MYEAFLCVMIFVSAFTFAVLFIAFLDRLQTEGDIAEIERLREDYKKVRTEGFVSPITAQATEKNQTIARSRKHLSSWWKWPFVSKKWNVVDYIEI